MLDSVGLSSTNHSIQSHATVPIRMSRTASGIFHSNMGSISEIVKPDYTGPVQTVSPTRFEKGVVPLNSHASTGSTVPVSKKISNSSTIPHTIPPIASVQNTVSTTHDSSTNDAPEIFQEKSIQVEYHPIQKQDLGIQTLLLQIQTKDSCQQTVRPHPEGNVKEMIPPLHPKETFAVNVLDFIDQGDTSISNCTTLILPTSSELLNHSESLHTPQPIHAQSHYLTSEAQDIIYSVLKSIHKKEVYCSTDKLIQSHQSTNTPLTLPKESINAGIQVHQGTVNQASQSQLNVCDSSMNTFPVQTQNQENQTPDILDPVDLESIYKGDPILNCMTTKLHDLERELERCL